METYVQINFLWMFGNFVSTILYVNYTALHKSDLKKLPKLKKFSTL